MRGFLTANLLLLCAVSCCASDAPADAELATARQRRLAVLTKSDGWLTLIGLHFLSQGSSTVGSAKDRDVILSAGPASLGTVNLSSSLALTFKPDPMSGVLVDGQPAASNVNLKLEGSLGGPTIVSSGTVSFFALERGGRIALRVKDSASDRLTHFSGLQYFPFEPALRIPARWVPFDRPQETLTRDIIGNRSLAKVTGRVVFDWQGKSYALIPTDEAPDEPLFFVFADSTSGGESYSMRFLTIPRPAGDSLVLDFNLARNPPCAFTPYATCPLPPEGNILDFPIRAGERIYQGN